MSIEVDLGGALEDFVTQLVESGAYPSKSDVVRDAVRLMQDREDRLASLDAAIARGIAAADAGDVSSVDDVRQRLRARRAETSSARG